MEFSPPAVTKCLVTGEMADQTHCQQGHEVLANKHGGGPQACAPLTLRTLAGPTGEGGQASCVPICNHKACIFCYYAGY